MFCPFAKCDCREDCAFRCNNVGLSASMESKTTTCIIASKLDSINEGQADQLSEILNEISK